MTCLDVGIKIEGIDQAMQKVRDAIQSLEPDVFIQWAETVENSATEICGDPDHKRIKFKPKPDNTIDMEFADLNALNCALQAIRRHLTSMPPTTKWFYEGIIEHLESKKAEIQEPS